MNECAMMSFKQIDRNLLYEKLHPSPSGIHTGTDGFVSLDVRQNGSHGYRDTFSADGNMLQYSKSTSEKQNSQVYKLPPNTPLNVYLQTRGRCYACGQYVVVSNNRNAWSLRRCRPP